MSTTQMILRPAAPAAYGHTMGGLARRGLHAVAEYIVGIHRRAQDRRALTALRFLTDRELQDIGVTRAQVGWPQPASLTSQPEYRWPS